MANFKKLKPDDQAFIRANIGVETPETATGASGMY